MNITNFITRKFRKGTGSSAIIYVPRHNYSEIQKKYINLIDIIGDKNLDFKQLITRLTSIKGTRPEFQKLNFGSENDAYQIFSFMESGINALKMQIEDTIQSEFRFRENILEIDDLYKDLTNLTLTADQKATLLEFEKIHTDKHLGKATSTHKQHIVEGLKSSQEILEAEHETQVKKIQKEEDILAMAELQNNNFKTVSQHQQKKYFQRKSSQFPELTKNYMEKLQETLNSTKSILNGANETGTFSFMESEPESRENNNESQEVHKGQ